jgi:hypothetical protein
MDVDLEGLLDRCLVPPLVYKEMPTLLLENNNLTPLPTFECAIVL